MVSFLSLIMSSRLWFSLFSNENLGSLIIGVIFSVFWNIGLRSLNECWSKNSSIVRLFSFLHFLQSRKKKKLYFYEIIKLVVEHVTNSSLATSDSVISWFSMIVLWWRIQWLFRLVRVALLNVHTLQPYAVTIIEWIVSLCRLRFPGRLNVLSHLSHFIWKTVCIIKIEVTINI